MPTEAALPLNDPRRAGRAPPSVTRRSRRSSTATSASPSPSCADAGRRGGAGPHRRRASSPATGSAIWAPNIGRVGRRRARRPPGRRRASSPLNTRFKGSRGGATSCARPAPGCCSPSPTSSTPTTSQLLGDRGRGARRVEEIVVLRGAGPRRHDLVGRLPRPGRRRSTPAEPQARAAAVTARRPRPTSSSPRAPPARPRARCSRHGAIVRAYDAWADVVGLREGDRYLIVNPFFHTFGLKAGILACAHQGRDDRPPPGVRRARR